MPSSSILSFSLLSIKSPCQSIFTAKANTIDRLIYPVSIFPCLIFGSSDPVAKETMAKKLNTTANQTTYTSIPSYSENPEHLTINPHRRHHDLRPGQILYNQEPHRPRHIDMGKSNDALAHLHASSCITGHRRPQHLHHLRLLPGRRKGQHDEQRGGLYRVRSARCACAGYGPLVWDCSRWRTLAKISGATVVGLRQTPFRKKSKALWILGSCVPPR